MMIPKTDLQQSCRG